MTTTRRTVKLACPACKGTVEGFDIEAYVHVEAEGTGIAITSGYAVVCCDCGEDICHLLPQPEGLISRLYDVVTKESCASDELAATVESALDSMGWEE